MTKKLIWVYKKAIGLIPFHLLLAFLLINLGALMPALQTFGLERVVQEIANIGEGILLKDSAILFWGTFLILAYIMPHILLFLQSIAVTYGIYDKFYCKFNTWFYLHLAGKDCQAFNDADFIELKEKAINALEVEAPVITIHDSILFSARILTIISLALVLIRFHWALFLLAAGLMIPIMLINRRNRLEATDLRAKQASLFVRAKYLWNTLSDRKTIKENRLMDYEDYMQEAWYREKEREIYQNIGLEKRIAKSNLIADAFQGLGYLLCTLLSIYLMKKGLITIAGFIAALNAFYYFQLEGTVLIENLNSVAKNGEFCAFIKDFAACYNTASAGGKTLKDNSPAEIVLKNVSYRYPGSDGNALAGISLSVEARESIAIVGANGSGKTTLVNLIAGLFEPTAGQVFINKENPRLIHEDSLFRALGVVPQQITRYQGKFKEILEMGMANLPESKWQEVFDLLDLSDFNDYFDSILGPEFGGSDLSGGQWQKLALARILAYPYGLVLLDEPTSNLDPVIEAEIFESMLAAMGKRTALIVSHRMALCTKVDRVVVMEKGRIVEVGSHSTLMAKNGLYSRMFLAQSC